MLEEMSQAIWNKWQKNLLWVLERVAAKGGEIQKPEIFPPVPPSQVEEFERATGLRLPTDFVDVVTNYTGGFRFAWSLYNIYDKSKYILTKTAIRGGNWEVPFIGASQRKSLLDLYQELQNEFLGSCNWIFRSEFDDNEDIQETRKVIPYCFPLYLFSGGGGDYTVLRIDVEPAQIIYLDHEWGFSVRDRAILGRGFVDYVTTWSNLGYPEVDRYCGFFEETTGTLSDTGSLAQEWMKWLSE